MVVVGAVGGRPGGRPRAGVHPPPPPPPAAALARGGAAPPGGAGRRGAGPVGPRAGPARPPRLAAAPRLPPRVAVQAGRRIATVGQDAELPTPLAFMTPRPKRSPSS